MVGGSSALLPHKRQFSLALFLSDNDNRVRMHVSFRCRMMSGYKIIICSSSLKTTGCPKKNATLHKYVKIFFEGGYI